MRETMDQLDEFWTKRKDPATFGQKTEPAGSEIEGHKDRRLQDVTARANDEKKSYGFLQSLKHKAFGKKQKPEVSRVDRSEDERRQSVVDRARRS